MSIPALLPDSALVRVDYLSATDDGITLVASAVQERPFCPDCQVPATRIHSRYHRQLAALAWQGLRVRLRLTSRRWFCDRPECSRRIFTERFPGLLSRSARRLDQLTETLRHLAYALGGEPGARVAEHLGIGTSPDTLLRLLRERGRQRAPHVPRVLGVDDFAFRRGHTYGTLLLDLETGAPVDLLPDRKAETLARWLEDHPGVEVISRDRGGSYADGARQGAPRAQQVADRWHLLKNLVEALEITLTSEQRALQQAAELGEPATEEAVGKAADPAGETVDVSAPPCPAAAEPSGRAERDRTRRRDRRRVAYEEVLRLHRAGYSLREIAEQTGKSRWTVSKYVRADAFPEIKQRQPRPTQLDPFRAYLERRWEEGCHNAAQLWREIEAQGYRGAVSLVRAYLSQRRARLPAEERRTSGPVPRKPHATRPPAPRALVWWLVGAPEKLTSEQVTFLARLTETCPAVQGWQELARAFFRLVRERDVEALPPWVELARRSGSKELASFATGLRRDWEAVVAGVLLPWSNGPVEGQINRLKALKRQMYGRAGFELLRARVLRPG
ncbi:MAG: ISL3 family transposase [Armatimonadota bacterium]